MRLDDSLGEINVMLLKLMEFHITYGDRIK